MVIELNLYSYPNKEKIIKVKVEIDTMKPIKPGMHIGSSKEGISWIGFGYERLLMLCFNYGIIGNNEDFCPMENQTELNPQRKNPYGPWLRSSELGRRVNEPGPK